MTKKTNIGVLFGGRSGEHEVSLVSASNVIRAIDRDKYDLTLIGITRDGNWKIYTGKIDNIESDTWEKDEANIKDDISLFSDDEIKNIDIFFPILHGTYGEDGTIQGLFEMLDKPYVGCGVLSSAAAMDKQIAKVIFESEGIPVAKSITINKSDIKTNINECIDRIESTFSYPIFIKPANAGSSVGISKVTGKDTLTGALYEAIIYDEKILIEECIDGYEVELAVLGNDQPNVSCPGMIVPCNDFYDYEAKYNSGDSSKIEIPAPLPQAVTANLKEYAQKAFKALCCSGLSRVDFFVKKDNYGIILNEINTMPGFTNISMYPKLWQASGIEYSALITKLIDFGFERYNNRKELSFKKH